MSVGYSESPMKVFIADIPPGRPGTPRGIPPGRPASPGGRYVILSCILVFIALLYLSSLYIVLL